MRWTEAREHLRKPRASAKRNETKTKKVWLQRNRQRQGWLSILHASGKWSKVQFEKYHPLWDPNTMSDLDKYSIRRMVECEWLRIQWWGVGNEQEKAGVLIRTQIPHNDCSLSRLMLLWGKCTVSNAAQAKIFHTPIYDMSPNRDSNSVEI